MEDLEEFVRRWNTGVVDDAMYAVAVQLAQSYGWQSETADNGHVLPTDDECQRAMTRSVPVAVVMKLLAEHFEVPVPEEVTQALEQLN